jgi:hypothetical protein
MSPILGKGTNGMRELSSSRASSESTTPPRISVPSIKKVKVGKTRTFLGCITCRNRRIKCDGRKPRCDRCQKSKRPCEGYGFKLRFGEMLVVDELGGMAPLIIAPIDEKVAKRQQLPLMKMPDDCSYTDFGELGVKLEQLESIAERNRTTHSRVGPFGVFPHTAVFSEPDPNGTRRHNNLHASYAGNITSSDSHISGSHCIKGQETYLEGSELSHSQRLPQKVERSLPPISSLINLPYSAATSSTTSVVPKYDPQILPLAPALEISHQTKKYHDKRDLLVSSTQHISSHDQVIQLDNESYKKPSGSLSDPIWVHPRLEIDAVLQYQTLIGSADVVTQSWDTIKRVIFAEKYGITQHVNNQIIHKIDLSAIDVDYLVKKYACDVFRSLNDYEPATLSVSSFSTLLRSQQVQELVRLFVKSHPSIMTLNFNGCVFNKVVIPTFYRVVGELMVFESSMGLPGDWEGKVSQDGIDFRNYCDGLKRTFCMVALALTAFSQYKVLFDEHGIYDGSLKLFKCYISLREMSIVNLAMIVKPFFSKDPQEKYDSTKSTLVTRLLEAGLMKELILTLVLAIYQDSCLDIINNYSLLYETLEVIKSLYMDLGWDDKEMDELWLWFRYIKFFYKSCSKIDIENYQLDEEGFDDISSDYNMIQNFNFDEHFKRNEYNGIEIQPASVETENDLNPVEYIQDDTSEDTDAVSSKDISGMMMMIPPRLSKRPEVKDRPPRSFVVRFHFSDSDNTTKGSSVGEMKSEKPRRTEDNTLISKEKGKNGNTHGPKLAKDYRRASKCCHGITDGVVSNSLSKGCSHIDVEDSGGYQKNELTGLLIGKNTDMTQVEREQLTEKGNIRISDPLHIMSDRTFQAPSCIELSFGIPVKLLELMERTVKLADHKDWCLRKRVFPRNFPKMCCDLEDELVNWKLEWDLYSTEGTNKTDMKFHSLFHKAVYHLTVTFFNTILVFFFRLIKELDPHLIQEHVSSVYSHLEQLKLLSLRSDFSRDMKISPPFWCFLVSGSDAISKRLQYKFDELARKWFVAGNKWIGKQIMMEVWRIRNESTTEDAASISWLDVIKDWEISGYS